MSVEAPGADEKPLLTVITDYLDAAKADESGGSRRDLARYADAGHFLDALKVQLFVSDSLKSLARELRANESGNKNADALLLSAQRGIDANHSWMVKHLGWDPLATAPSYFSAEKAQQVFDVQELAEMILGWLSTKHLFRAAQVNKAFAQCTRGSLRLQTILYLRADPNSFWRSHFDEYRIRHDSSFGVKLDDPHRSRRRRREEVEVVARVYESNRGYRPLSSRPRIPPCECIVRSMLICQPPVTEMAVMPQCCQPDYSDTRNDLPPSSEPTVVRSSTGWTIGELLDVAAATAKSHRLCPYADKDDIDDTTGEAIVDVIFRGKLVLRPDDPVLPPVSQVRPDGHYSPAPSWSPDRFGGYEQYEPPPETELDRYIAAKKDALIDGLPIPTLEQFREWDKWDCNQSPGYSYHDDTSLPEDSPGYGREDDGLWRRNGESYDEAGGMGGSDQEQMAWPDYYDRSRMGDSGSGETEYDDREETEHEDAGEMPYIDRDKPEYKW